MLEKIPLSGFLELVRSRALYSANVNPSNPEIVDLYRQSINQCIQNMSFDELSEALYPVLKSHLQAEIDADTYRILGDILKKNTTKYINNFRSQGVMMSRG